MSSRQQALALCERAHQRVIDTYKGLQQEAQELAQAVDLYMAAVELAPQLDEPYLGLAYLAFVGGDQEQALQLLTQAEQLNTINMRTQRLKQKILRSAYRPAVQSVDIEDVAILEEDHPVLDVSLLVDPETMSQESQVEPLAEPVEQPDKPPPGLQILADLGPPNRPGKVSSGPEVLLLQQLLLRLGFQLTANGVYDAATLNAVRNFQYRKQLPPTGVPDPKTKAFFNHLLSKLKTTDLQLDTTNEASESLWEEAEMPETFTSDLGPADRPEKISTGPEVLLLQELLTQLDYDIAISGEYDKPTGSAIRSFQVSQKLPVSGLVDSKTRLALNQVLEQTFVENAVGVELMQLIWQFRKSRGLSFEGLMSLQLKAWLQQVLQWVKQKPAPDAPLQTLPESPERILLESLLTTPGQMGVVSQGLEVIRLQEVLAELGYSLEISGNFDMPTFSALKDYQQKHHLVPNGVAEGETHTFLNAHLRQRYAQEEALENLWRGIEKLQQAFGIALSEKAYQNLAPLLEQLLLSEDIAPLTSELGPANRPGKISQGHEVSLVKGILNQAGYELTSQTPLYDMELYNEMRQFQQKHQLPMTGLVDEKTRLVLNEILQAR